MILDEVEKYYREGAHQGDRGLLRERRGEHLPRVAALRAVPGSALKLAGVLEHDGAVVMEKCVEPPV
jgi:hypothetical protein